MRTFEEFIEAVRRSQPIFDGCVPVVMICVPASVLNAEGVLLDDASVRGVRFRTLWPAGWEKADDRRRLLRMVMETCEDVEVEGDA